ncbi:hypothetical protein HYT18_02695 [Candidatus Microgenomates bacterium]|nr:hypothetical protein [Candidatus Microgenomates bacterium]
MAIQQTKKQSDLEKRLRLLRQQVYGKVSEHSENSVNQRVRKPDNLTLRYSDTLISSGTPSHSEPFRSDITYLRHDLIKIGTLATLAFGIQAILYYFLQNHIVNLNFF